MKQYLDIVDNVLHNGVKKDNRTGISTISTFAETFKHDMSDGFPLLTTKKMAINAILVELEGFIKGITSKKWYQDRGCNIWNEWSNPLAGPSSLVGTCLTPNVTNGSRASLQPSKNISFFARTSRSTMLSLTSLELSLCSSCMIVSLILFRL